jgi:5'(3')-deoxyribonucleotidase
MRILVDLDCVLADFVGGCCAAWGLSTAEVLAHWEPGVYPINAALALALAAREGRPLYDVQPMPDSRFWARLNGNGAFWEGLAPLPWCHELTAEVARTTPDWHVVTAPSWCVTSYDGKVRWLKARLGERFDRFFITPHKYALAGPGTILIEDNEKNCRDFEVDPLTGRATGGRAVLFPAHHNRLHLHGACPLRVVRPALAQLVKELS